MRTPYQLCRPSFRCFMVAAALLLLWSMPALVLPQEGKIKIGTESRAREITRERERYKASHPWVTEQQLDIVQWRFEHPGSSTEDYWNWKRNGHLPDHNHAPSNSAALDSRTPSQDELLAAVRQTGATLLKPADARGWGYVGYTRGNLSDPRSEEVRFSPGKDNPARVEKFFLVDNPFLFLAKGSDFTHQNTIEIPLGEHLTGQDLTRFYQVNNRFLRDVPFSTPASANSLPSLPKIENSNAMVITGARLANGEEVLTIFSLADLARTGAVHGEVYTDSYQVRTVDWGLSLRQMVKDSEGSARPPRMLAKSGLEEVLRRRLGDMSAGRVYYYGDRLKKVDLAALCSEFGREMILRSPHIAHDLVETEYRLQRIAERSLEEEQLAIVDGLPESAAAVDAMGPLVGNPKGWLDFHEKVDESLRDRAARHITTQEEFFAELSQGESDLLILVAHSTGSQLYLNGRKTSIKELQALPSRTEKSPRPRLAVLISCDAGRANSDSSGSLLSRLFGKELSSLAQILIEKRFVDKVLAPNHKIGADESLKVLRRALEGSRTHAIFEDWVPWAIDWLRTLEPAG